MYGTGGGEGKEGKYAKENERVYHSATESMVAQPWHVSTVFPITMKIQICSTRGLLADSYVF